MVCVTAGLYAAIPFSASADVFATDEPLALKLSAPFTAVFRQRAGA